MDPKEPAQRKRKVEGTTVPPRPVTGGFTVVNGIYVQVEKPVDDDVEWSSDDDVDPAVGEEFHRQLRESDVNILLIHVFFVSNL